MKRPIEEYLAELEAQEAAREREESTRTSPTRVPSTAGKNGRGAGGSGGSSGAVYVEVHGIMLLQTKGLILGSEANIRTALGPYVDFWRWDSFRDQIELVRPLKLPTPTPGSIPMPGAMGAVEFDAGDWSEGDAQKLGYWLTYRYKMPLSSKTLMRVIKGLADEREYSSAADWLAGLKWDGTERLSGLFEKYFHAEGPADYLSGVSRAWMISIVARVLDPGCKVDYMVILYGAQGAGKNKTLRGLIGDDWFLETHVDVTNKDAVMALRGRMVVCLDELASMRGTSRVEAVKSFITRQFDVIRRPFAAEVSNYPRACVFAGTTNEEKSLTDQTGNRRFWIIRCVGALDAEVVRKDREQLFAEAVHAYKTGELWWPNTDLFRLAEVVQAEHTMDAPFLEELELLTSRFESWRSEGFTQTMLLKELKLDTFQTPAHIKGQLGITLKKLGWIPKRVKNGRRTEVRYYHIDADHHFTPSEVAGRPGTGGSN